MILAAIVIAGATILASRPVAFGATLGAGLMVVNALAMRRIGQRVLSASRPGAAVILLNLKLLALIALVYVCITVLHLSTLGFLLGISVFPAAIVIAALRAGMSPAEPTDPATDGDSPRG
jgi:hypothetical protein